MNIIDKNNTTVQEGDWITYIDTGALFEVLEVTDIAIKILQLDDIFSTDAKEPIYVEGEDVYKNYRVAPSDETIQDVIYEFLTYDYNRKFYRIAYIAFARRILRAWSGQEAAISQENEKTLQAIYNELDSINSNIINGAFIPDISIGEVKSGEEAAAEIIGNHLNPILNLTIPSGRDGTSINPQGTLESIDELMSINNPTQGDMYTVNKEIYVYNDNEEWISLGTIEGTKGDTTYIHIAYGDDSSGHGLSINDSNKPYLGLYTSTHEEQSLDPEKYRWTKIKGNKGDDGQVSHIHIAYGDDSSGSNLSFTDSNKPYLGLYSDTNEEQSDNPDKYQWSKIQGKQGIQGVQGETGDSGATYKPKVEVDGTLSWTNDKNLKNPAPVNIKGDIGKTPQISIGTVETTPNPMVEVEGTTDEPILNFGLPKGEKGEKGDRSTITVGTVETGIDASVTNSGTKNDAIFDFILPKGEKGDRGLQGERGKPGTGVTILGSYDSEAALIEAHPSGKSGDSYIVNGDLFVWNGSSWENVGNIQGPQGKQGIQGEAATIKVGTVSSGTSATVTNSGDSHNAIFNFTLPRGEKGEQGDQGIQGPKGADGKSSYTHIAYANSADGKTDFTVSDSNRKYIGMYVDFTQADSTDPTKYSWSLIKGADGAQGTPGKAGADGKTPYLHIAYATSADGKTGFSISDSTNKTYIGQYTDYIQADSTDPTKYAWTRIKGDKGDQGIQGEAATINIGTVTTGDTTTVTNSGTEHEAVFNFTLEKGKKGDRGLRGIQGEKGDTPVKGIDYWTKSDKNEIIDEAISLSSQIIVLSSSDGKAYSGTWNGTNNPTNGTYIIAIPSSTSTTKSPTLSIGTLGALPIKRYNLSGDKVELYNTSALSSGKPYPFILDNGNWMLVNKVKTEHEGKSYAPSTHTTVKATSSTLGHVKLSNATNSTSETEAATPAAVNSVNTTMSSKVSSLESNKAPNNHASTNTTYGVATGDKYGHVKLGGNGTKNGVVSNANHTHDYVPTSEYTASDVLNKLKTVDGINSGLDAEYLGGVKHDSYARKTDIVKEVHVGDTPPTDDNVVLWYDTSE